MPGKRLHEQAPTQEGVLSRPFPPRSSSPSGPFVRVNGKIRAREVRVIGEEGKQLGVMSLGDALTMARSQGVDLVEIAADGQAAGLPPGRLRQVPLRTSQARKREQKVAASSKGQGAEVQPEHLRARP